MAAIPLQITASAVPPSLREDFLKLAPRERDVLVLIARGYSAPEIGERLGISPKTVHTYKFRIHEKLGLSHRTHYVQFALGLGVLAESPWQRTVPAPPACSVLSGVRDDLVTLDGVERER